MKIGEYVRTRYKVQNIVERRIKDPIALVMEQDNIPFDCIMVVDGVLQKVVAISDDEYIPVVELISYYKEEVEKMTNEDFKIAYFAYMDNIDIQDVSIELAINASREYLEKKGRKGELLHNVQNSAS